MLPTTVETIRSVLKCDTTLSPADRSRILATLRIAQNPPRIESATNTEVRLIRRAEAAKRLGCSMRLVDRLARDGILQKRKLPNRQRAAGFLESDLNALISTGMVIGRPAAGTDCESN